ncbi:MAG: DinB family protein [Planctomycetota bacterium]|nr:DinB family protein [Planctomycetota bacterium]MDA1179082.1 DinB family protein [Planctomycetota bacterium]
MVYTDLIQNYLAGPQQLRSAIAGMTSSELDAVPQVGPNSVGATNANVGQWSTRQVICHLADFEPVYADRMKRVIAEHEPTLFGGDPDLFAARLEYDARDIEEELHLIESVRRHVARILKAIPPEYFDRTGFHSMDGPITLQVLLQRITKHIPHHVNFVEAKRAQLATGRSS